MTTHLGLQHHEEMITVDAYAPNPEHEHDPLPEQILGIALDQRAFGPRQLMVAFASYDGRFLMLTYGQRTDPVDAALEASFLHFDSLGRGGEQHAAAVVLCDQPVAEGPVPPEFVGTFERAQRIARKYSIHLIDWFACDDELIRGVRLRTFAPATEPGWWDAP